jgi:hypothetical protein
MHEPWVNDAAAFITYILAELGHRPTPKHSLDRKENGGHYEPGNLRWATAQEQNRNRRCSKLTERDVRLIKLWLDEGHSQASVARAFGLDQGYVSQLRSGQCWADIMIESVPSSSNDSSADSRQNHDGGSGGG